jgi:dual specificity MAP kinase phosphatase
LIAFLERALAPVGTRPAISTLGGLHVDPPAHAPRRTRPLKVLVYSADGYTESSVLALALLMALRGLTLPEAYLILQVEKRRSFFVYNTDLPVLRRVETRVNVQKEQRGRATSSAATALGLRRGSVGGWAAAAPPPGPPPASSSGLGMGKPSSMSRASGAMAMYGPDPLSPVSAGAAGTSGTLPNASAFAFAPQSLPVRRPRASTSPWLPSVFGDHQSWFADPRFDGSFPSRVLPFLYLGNL